MTVSRKLWVSVIGSLLAILVASAPAAAQQQQQLGGGRRASGQPDREADGDKRSGHDNSVRHDRSPHPLGGLPVKYT